MFKRKLLAVLAGIPMVAATFVGVAASPTAAAPPVAPPVVAATPPPDVTAPPIAMPKLPKKQGNKPKGVKAKKGMPGASGGVSTFSACGTPCFYYAGARRDDAVTPVDGISVRMGVYQPVQDTNYDYHNLGEIAVQKDVGGLRQIVEIGYTVDPAVNAGCTPNPACLDDPHLFVFHWVNGVGACYNGCGFVDYAATALDAGDSLNSYIGNQYWTRVQYFQGNWWVAFDNLWIGYFPGSLWTGASPAVTTFTNSTYQQVFGEIATDDTTTCGDMGNGIKPTAVITAARMGSLNKIVGGTSSLSTYTSTIITAPSKWDYVARSGSTFDYGGPGC